MFKYTLHIIFLFFGRETRTSSLKIFTTEPDNVLKY